MNKEQFIKYIENHIRSNSFKTKEDLYRYLLSLQKREINYIITEEDIKELLQISNIYISASKQEGLPRATMEAMAMGLPCIVSNIRGHIDLIEDNKGGYLCNNIQDFSNSILKLLNNPLRYQ